MERNKSTAAPTKNAYIHNHAQCTPTNTRTHTPKHVVSTFCFSAAQQMRQGAETEEVKRFRTE